MREQELIQKLEEASDEIEALLKENEKLMQFELQKTKNPISSHKESLQPSETDNQRRKQEYEQTMLDAILNDQSRSCDSESHDDLVVACIGQKPPLSSAASSKPSRMAFVRIMPDFSWCDKPKQWSNGSL